VRWSTPFVFGASGRDALRLLEVSVMVPVVKVAVDIVELWWRVREVDERVEWEERRGGEGDWNEGEGNAAAASGAKRGEERASVSFWMGKV
jgi:hypothetical protein